MSRGVPAGWALVPVEPTEDMVEAGKEGGLWRDGELTFARNVYKSMLTATPTPPIEGRDADVERVEPIDLLMDKRLIAEAAAKALNPNRDLALNPLYVGDPAWRIATEVQDAARAALQALGERG